VSETPEPGAGRAALQHLQRPDRPAALAQMVAAEFRSVLQMMPQEVLPLDESFFDLGLTSLSVEEVKQRLESSLACRVDAEVLFNHPTVQHLVAHLQAGPLADLFGAATPAPAAVSRADTEEQGLVDDMLARLYSSS
jgi:acyl carrier protein